MLTTVSGGPAPVPAGEFPDTIKIIAGAGNNPFAPEFSLGWKRLLWPGGGSFPVMRLLSPAGRGLQLLSGHATSTSKPILGVTLRRGIRETRPPKTRLHLPTRRYESYHPKPSLTVTLRHTVAIPGL